ncbi:hypothetical protein [Pseudomonas coronafaciens]|uniref:Integrase n=1 Tax=Pseudomonas coronafaciens pv. coronafaciens TaxID=235275 RepID=A0AAE6UM81_9PSED|nr:hypothetical protein [Pseudomonas coronafaciens]QGT82225.1 hypothetical protein GMO17_14090 [Pseudomonas coronafaciens pv. coronafaciens]RMM83490.1 hypothetical protein ALQ71_03691 [Pseudomonas coronafaciens pv. striafaciens]RMS12093.1 hypothetical protein ALP72_05647 [Pseudomonas coronafaciens pv. coronafaciens]
MLNKYLARLEALVTSYNGILLPQFRSGSLGTPGFDDTIWFYVDGNTGRRTKFLCGQVGQNRKHHVGVPVSEQCIPYPYSHLLKVWIIECAARNISAKEKAVRVNAARKLLSAMNGHLFVQTSNSIENIKLRSGATRLQPFLQFCLEKGLTRKISLVKFDKRDRSGHASFDKQQSKLPDLKSIVAIGSIFHEIFSNIDESGVLIQGRSVHVMDALVVTFALLSLASPNRLAAEVSVLPKQFLQSHSEAVGEPVYYLDWIGSKCFKDNKNHILSALSGPVDKAIKFFMLQCEPARIVCRFYENPGQNLGSLLGNYKIASELSANLNMRQVPNLFVLGYALGFYRADDTVPIVDECRRAGPRFKPKPIYALRGEDILSGSLNLYTQTSALPRLFGYTSLPNFFGTHFDTVSVEFAQSSWIEHFKNTLIPEFPVSYSSGDSFIRLSDSMFCFVGNILYSEDRGRGAGARPLQNSKFSIMPLASMALSACRRLTGKYGLSIFEKYGFAPEHSIKPHSLRHFSNTLADRSEIPIEVITAWSGRVNPDQTHTYIHTSHEERAEKISAIMNPLAGDEKSIRIISKMELVDVTNTPASITSTGVCMQDLNVTPCDYLNDFVAQCFKCAQACYVAGDQEAVTLLSKDLAYQYSRLEAVASDLRLHSSQAMQRWYLLHSRNTHILKKLIALMKVESLGALISYTESSTEFTINRIEGGPSKRIVCALPDFHLLLNKLLACPPSLIDKPNSDLAKILENFGLGTE